MIDATMINEAIDRLRKDWPNDGNIVIKECILSEPFEGSFEDFLTHCYACGGDFGALILTGIKKLYPNVWDAIPNQMGKFAFVDLCTVLILLGVDTTE